MLRLLHYPLWVAQLFTGAKSFRDNPVLGNYWLNRLGLHVARLALAHAIMRLRFMWMSGGVPKEFRRQYLQQGFLVVEDYLSVEQFAQVNEEMRQLNGEVRECVQGNTQNHRLLLSPSTLERAPATRTALSNPAFLRLMRFTAAHRRLPIMHRENVRNGFAPDTGEDPQKYLHSDTFHPTMKFWLFLDDVSEDNGPFTYVPQSNRLSWKRLRWEYRNSLTAAQHTNSYSARGSFRFTEADRQALGLPEPNAITVKKNTLVIANTFGIHGRGQALTGTSRLALWGMQRSNPFIPFPGLGLTSQLQYRVLEWWRQREDRRAERKGQQSSWHKLP